VECGGRVLRGDTVSEFAVVTEANHKISQSVTR
jgi:hypothetical protein